MVKLSSDPFNAAECFYYMHQSVSFNYSHKIAGIQQALYIALERNVSKFVEHSEFVVQVSNYLFALCDVCDQHDPAKVHLELRAIEIGDDTEEIVFWHTFTKLQRHRNTERSLRLFALFNTYFILHPSWTSSGNLPRDFIVTHDWRNEYAEVSKRRNALLPLLFSK